MSSKSWFTIKLLLPALLVLSSLLWPAPSTAQVSGEEVYGLQGIISTAEGQPFGHYFDANERYGLVGKTPEVETELTDAARTQPAQAVKIWGQIDARGGSDPPIVVVTSVLAPQAPTSTPNPTPSDIIAIVVDGGAMLRTGPDGVYPAVRRLDKGEACDILGKNGEKQNWFVVKCVKDNASGWLRRDLIRIVGQPAALPIVAIPPTPVPTPNPTATSKPYPTATPRPTATSRPPTPQRNQWRAEYNNTVNLSGKTVVDRIEPRDGTYPLDRRWYGTPVPGVRDENWSARWAGPFHFDSGDYLFKANYNGGGVRVFIDDIQVLTAWNKDSGTVSNTFAGIGDGIHTIRIEHPNREKGGRLRVWWQKQDRTRDE